MCRRRYTLEIQPAKQRLHYSSIIPQAHSRVRPRVTKETFAKIMLLHDVFPYSLETVQAFGVRTQDESNTWNNFHCRRLKTDGEGRFNEGRTQNGLATEIDGDI